MSFKGVIFDLDGTLINSLEDIGDSMNRVLQRQGFPSHDIQEYKYLTGKGMRNLMHEALPKAVQNDELITECYNLMLEEYRNNCLNKTKPYKGIVEMLNELTLRKMKLAVLSNKSHELTTKIVTTLLSNWKFEVITGLSAEIPRKPDPSGALIISREFGIYPEDIIYIGDTDVDMQTANNAGMYAAGALWGFRTKEELIANGAKYLLSEPLDLIKMLDAGNSV